MKIKKDFSLKAYNTFGIDAKAKFFVEVQTVDELRQILKRDEFLPKFILGGGSNMLLTKDINGVVIHIAIKGISVVSEDNNYVTLTVMAGENWHETVLWTLTHGYGGLENMSLIPGNMGTAPIQNIGAYGTELKDCFVSCEAMERTTHKLVTFSKEDCRFGYRESFFKNEGKDQYIITSVTLKLTRKNHNLNTSYGAIEDELINNNITRPNIKEVSNAVINIRNRRLPDPKELGNSGSFFKNPVVDQNTFERFSQENPEAPFYKISDTQFKIPAGWLIEQCGFKGKRFGDAGVHKNQALVLVNYGNATGKEILNLADTIINAVEKKFQIKITPEVNLIK
ncbi:UDP-N-acetylmuramate dehydrogenase [Maribacter antarcticus]|uniref:UDP-N-acetylmuramate dehydrogenase n=1 Tax=Maribacter antarcticus TaxID=505250 RepID=UPI00047D1EB1|nr:UDP-N-acetylmuramate dehydrogenase [Maribacter antarcticus]